MSLYFLLISANTKAAAVRTLSSVLLSSLVLSTAVLPTQVSANEVAPSQSSSNSVDEGTLQVTFVPPNGDAPSETRGGAARGSCVQTDALEDDSVAALIPASNYGLTAKSHPVFLVYLPAGSPDRVFFNLKNESGESVYEAFLDTQGDAGIIRVAMPEDAPMLEVGNMYEWGVAVPCSGRLRPDSPFASGWVQRVGNETVSSLPPEGTNTLESVNQYAQAGIWYDMIAMLDILHEEHANDLQFSNVWQDVLRSVQLDHLDS